MTSKASKPSNYPKMLRCVSLEEMTMMTMVANVNVKCVLYGALIQSKFKYFIIVKHSHSSYGR